MGVHGLWELLAPVGRRVSVETLAGKKLAIDASIWMIQFMKAMRDEKGEMIRNAHILGFFRRICKLLFLRTKPVFVFDGGTPALKRRTVIARRRQRENAQAKIRKTAEKLLLNHLKAIRLKELAEDLEKQRKENDVKGKKPIIEEPNNVQQTEKGNDDVDIDYNQEELDAMLAASLAAEEKEGFTVDASTSGAAEATNDEVFVEDDEDEDEEMILPEMHGKVDPAVLAALPPSMQLDLLVQMRERLMAENRQKYQKVKKAPERFSELQIQSYLKTVAFRREIDGVQKAAAGRGIGGMQTSRIASEANREFIFSSSFTGDKQAFTSVGLEKVQAEQSQPPPVSEVLFTKKSSSAAGSAVAEAEKQFHDDVETYMDERGRVRVSRVRALGIRMTRDLQRNLDLMKEIDQEKVEKNQEKDNESTIQHGEITDKGSNGMNDEVVNGTSIEISFDDTLENEEDELFASLVAGDNYAMEKAKQSSHSESDCEWEEGVIEDRSTPNVFEGDINDEREVEWEEGFQNSQLKSSICPDESMKAVRKGNLEEEADFQEAIRRSLEVIEDKNTSNTFEKGINDEREVEWEEEFQDIQMKSSTCPDESAKTVRKGNMEEEADFQEAIRRSLEVIEDKNTSNTFEKGINDEREVEWEEGIQDIQMNSVCPDESMTTGGKGNLEEEADFQEGIRRSIEENDFHEDQVSEIDKEMVKDDADLVPVDEEKEGPESNFSEAKSETFVESKPDNSNLGDNHSCYAEVGKISANDFTTNVDSAKELAEEETFSNPTENEEVTINSSINYDNIEQDMMKDYLEEEMLNLGKEREELGSEQRKQERNAESVSSEMFAECQELLQMFGLPYIIAPMEAEAQCAFMELSNLVDGVVTDDSDAFLFGARSVFKNIFDDRKYVETYLMKDIEDELGLDREKLIHMAMLLGSDYTEGISGIGIVNAIEVVNAFPEKDGLREFREWIESPDPSILGVHPKKKGSNDSENLPVDDVKRIKEIFMDKHRNVSKNWHIPSTFPSDAVISAYASPQVDKSTEPFGWGKPDLFILRKLCWEKFGWNTSKTDELLVPVLKEYNKHETQLRLEAFYTFNERFAKVRSKRINKALKGITGQKSSEKTPRNSESGKKRKVKASQDEVNLSGVDSTAGNSIQNSNTKKQKTSKRNVEKSVKNRGRGRGQVSAKGRKKKESSSEDSKSDEEMETVRSQETCRVRRSDRVRKTVNYNVSEEFENCDKEIENSLKEVETTTEVSFDQPAGGHYNLDENELNKSIPSMDTTSPSEIDGSKIEDHADLSNDYLQFGGGFCVDEDEEGKEGDKLQPSPTREKIPDESVDLNRTDIDRMSGISPKPLNGGDFPDMELSMNLDDTEDNDAPKSYLRAMPNLRRKRRKN